MPNLTHAHHELFRRSPDERFESLESLVAYCGMQKTESTDRWHLPQHLAAKGGESGFFLEAGDDGAFLLNDWSFGQQGRLTIFAVVDALTRMAGNLRNAGERLAADQKAATLLDLVA